MVNHPSTRPPDARAGRGGGRAWTCTKTRKFRDAPRRMFHGGAAQHSSLDARRRRPGRPPARGPAPGLTCRCPRTRDPHTSHVRCVWIPGSGTATGQPRSRSARRGPSRPSPSCVETRVLGRPAMKHSAWGVAKFSGFRARPRSSAPAARARVRRAGGGVVNHWLTPRAGDSVVLGDATGPQRADSAY